MSGKISMSEKGKKGSNDETEHRTWSGDDSYQMGTSEQGRKGGSCKEKKKARHSEKGRMYPRVTGAGIGPQRKEGGSS